MIGDVDDITQGHLHFPIAALMTSGTYLLMPEASCLVIVIYEQSFTKDNTIKAKVPAHEKCFDPAVGILNDAVPHCLTGASCLFLRHSLQVSEKYSTNGSTLY